MSRALSDVDLDIYEGEILALVGDNGAGKSTLIKILAGVHQPDRGEIQLSGEPTMIGDPHKARELGIATVYQNLALVDLRDVAANLYLGREPVRWRWFVDRQARCSRSAQGARRPPGQHPVAHREVGQLSGGQRQSIAIGRATSQRGRIIIMDEPTAALGVKESRKVLDLIVRLKEGGTGVVDHQPQHATGVLDRRPDSRAPSRPERRRPAPRRDDAGRDRQDDRRHRDSGLRTAQRMPDEQARAGEGVSTARRFCATALASGQLDADGVAGPLRPLWRRCSATAT